jgi:hypothetical protein
MMETLREVHRPYTRGLKWGCHADALQSGPFRFDGTLSQGSTGIDHSNASVMMHARPFLPLL